MKRIAGCLGVLVIAIGVLLYAAKTPLQEWAVDLCLQRHCQSAFGAPLAYSGLRIANGSLTLNNPHIDSSADYSLSAQSASIPYYFAFPYLNFAALHEWHIQAGVVTWHDDLSFCLVDCQPNQGTLTFQGGGTVAWKAGQWAFTEVPLHSLMRLASLQERRWRAWKAESGEITGAWNGIDGSFAVRKPHIRHLRYPISMQADHGQLRIVNGAHVTFDSPMTLSMGGAFNNFLPPSHWTLEVVDRDTLQWIWEFPLAQAGRLATTIRSVGDQVALAGIYQSPDAEESLQFQMDIPKEGPVTGHITGKSLSLQSTLARFANQFLEGKWSGRVDLEGDLQGPLFTTRLQPRDLTVETSNSQVSFEALTSPIVIALDLSTNRLHTHLQTDHSSFLDKNTGLLLSEITATIDASENEWHIRDLEAYHQNLRFVGEGTYTKSDHEHSQLMLHVDAITGRFSQLQEMLVFLNPKGLVQVIPLDGDVQLSAKGGDLSFITTAQGRQLTVSADGVLLDGKWKSHLGNLSIQEVGAQFTYAYPANTLTLRDLQGTIFIGRPSDRLEEYQFSGDQMTFTDYGKQQLHFDLWVGDRRRDVLRLAGSTELGSDGALQFRFDKALSHLGSVHPDIFELSLLNWSQVNAFQLGLNFRLDRFLHDLQRIDRTGLVPIDEKLSKGLQSLNIVDGLCRFDCRYERATNTFDYRLSSDLLSLNHRLHRDFELKGNVQGDAWLVDPLRWNDLAFSAELVKFPDRWRIDFLGVKVGDFMLAGLEGNYIPQRERIEARVNLLQGKVSAALGLQHLMKNATLVADMEQVRIDAVLNYRNQPVWVLFRTTWSDPTSGTLALSDAYPVTADALTINWNQEPNHLFVASRAQGTFFGINADLKRDPRKSDTGVNAIGTVKLDWQQVARLLPEELATQIRRWRLGSGYVLKGHWRLSGLLPETVHFRGELLGDQCVVGDCTLEHLKSTVRISPQEIALTNFTLSDRSFRMKADGLALSRTTDGRWMFGCHQLVGEDVDPSKLTGLSAHYAADLAGWSLPICAVDDLSGYLEDSASVMGNGSIQFLRSSRLRAPNRPSSNDLFARLAVPDLALPVTGLINWEVADRTMTLTALKDVYSEGKLLKFSLLKNQSVATLDFDGQLNMRIRVKPTRQLLKLTDKSILSIQGSLKMPNVVLQDDK